MKLKSKLAVVLWIVVCVIALSSCSSKNLKHKCELGDRVCKRNAMLVRKMSK